MQTLASRASQECKSRSILYLVKVYIEKDNHLPSFSFSLETFPSHENVIQIKQPLVNPLFSGRLFLKPCFKFCWPVHKWHALQHYSERPYQVGYHFENVSFSSSNIGIAQFVHPWNSALSFMVIMTHLAARNSPWPLTLTNGRAEDHPFLWKGTNIPSH